MGEKNGVQRKVSEIPPQPITIPKLIFITSEGIVSHQGKRRNAIWAVGWLLSFHFPASPGLFSSSFPKMDWPSYSSQRRTVAPHSFIQGWKLIPSKSTLCLPFPHIIISLHLDHPLPLLLMWSDKRLNPSHLLFTSFLLTTYFLQFFSHHLSLKSGWQYVITWKVFVLLKNLQWCCLLSDNDFLYSDV